ncbi:putative DD41D transposase [Trichonephila clavipes]|nr:putative DD41D transposase [Trichonephila clavipes]
MEEVCSLLPASLSTLGVWRFCVNYFWRQLVENLSINREGSIDLGVEMAELSAVGAGQGILLEGWLEGRRYELLQGAWSVSSASSIVGRVGWNLTLLRILSFQVIYSQFGLEIHQNDHQARRRFVEWAQNEIAVVPDFQKRILFSDEAHFWLNGYVNKKNCRIWSEANSQVYVETPLHPEKLTVWCALWAGEIIGPYFFKNDEGHNFTVNGDRYRAMITNFFIPELNNHDIHEPWFQQDGATCHTAHATIDLLKDTFGDRLISRFGPVNWHPRSCDLTPLDYFLWAM